MNIDKKHLFYYPLIQSEKLKPTEMALMLVVSSYSKGSFLTVEEVGRKICLKRRAAQALITRMVRTGLIGKQLCRGKRVRLWISPVEIQKYWLAHVGDTSLPYDYVPELLNKSDMGDVHPDAQTCAPTCTSDVHPDAHPIKKQLKKQ